MMAAIKTVNLAELGKKHQGKVRDYYILGNKRVLVTTDRISSFDRVLGVVPHKGQVLNQLAAFWFEKTRDIIPNHLICLPDPNAALVKNCAAYPIEMVVRGYITGVTTTSLWHGYSQGKREIYGLKFPDGLAKNQKLPQPVITPTTRGTGPGGHDEKVTREEIIERGVVPKKIYEQMEAAALRLFERGTVICKRAGLILVDTKYEFGDYNGELSLIDEIHTPDSSRFWVAGSYEKRISKGQEPENFDKEFFRLWYAKRGYKGDGKAPDMPVYYRQQVSLRYRQVFEKITGEKFVLERGSVEKRIRANLMPLLDQVVIIAGSKTDKQFASLIGEFLAAEKIRSRIFYASAHKQPREVLEIIESYNRLDERKVFITIAGRSNALSGFVAANTTLPVIACPPFKDNLDYLINIHSSLQMPSKTPVMTVINPENAALAAARIIG